MRILFHSAMLITALVGASAYAPTPTSLPPTPAPLATPSISLEIITGTHTTTITREYLEQAGVPQSTIPFLEGAFNGIYN